MPVSSAPYDGGNYASTLTVGSVTTSDAVVLIASRNRKRLMLWNNDVVDIFVSFGNTCTTTQASMVLDASGGYFLIDGYSGPVRATVAAGTASLWITEWA